MDGFEINNNEQLNRFEASLEDEKAFINYKKESDGTFILTHTEVPQKFEGKGVGSRLVKQTLEKIKANGNKLESSCPFVSSYIERHPEYRELIKQ